MEPNFWFDLEREYGIKLPQTDKPGMYKIVCPSCNGKGSKGFEGKTLSVTVDDKGVVWYCNRQNNCGHTGSKMFTRPETTWRIHHQKKEYKAPQELKPIVNGLDDRIVEWFKKRGIGAGTLKDWGVTQADRKDYSGNARRWVAFPIRDWEEKLVNVKYRTITDKIFSQEKGARQIFYGLNKVPKDAKVLYIVEGEMDALSMWEAGYHSVVSPPAGGISEKSIGKLSEDSAKFDFLAHAGDWLDQFDHYILACDFDAVGKALMEELARRLGREKCWRVHWPENADGSFIKDANECLVALGAEGLRECVEAAEPWPIHDVHNVSDFAGDVWKLYRGQVEKPLSTGFDNLDKHMKIRKGELSVVTGIPNSGKSEMLDQLMLNMVKHHKWKFGICSFENAPRYHIAKLCEKVIGAPFFTENGAVRRASEREVQDAMEYLNQNIQFIRADDPDKRPPNIDWIVERAKAMVRQFGIHGLVIDPYNEIESTRSQHMTETEFVSYILGKLKRFAQTYDVHVFIVAHPAKMRSIDGETPIPGLYDISGSAHWANKADVGWCVSRDRKDTTKPVELHVLKVRFKECGTAGGVAQFWWDRWSGRYEGIPDGQEEEIAQSNVSSNAYYKQRAGAGGH